MGKIKINDKLVDVAYPKCKDQKCFYLFEDKGSFVPGRGYTSYRKKPQWVCGTRHLHGCPRAGVCKQCRTILTPGSPRDKCIWCYSTDLVEDE